MNLTKNFTLEELTGSATARRLGIDNTPNAKQMEYISKLAQELQTIRDAFGRSIVVNSGFRCEKLNKAVGGAGNSDHKYGCAVDIESVGGKYNKQLWNVIVKLAEEGKIHLRQIIDEYNLSWIHISINNEYNETQFNRKIYIK